MGFSTDYQEINDDYGLIPCGDYEVIIRNIEERTTKNGATGLNLSLVIRNDVEQGYKDRYVFHTLWKRKEPTAADEEVQGYSFNQIMRLAKSAKLPSGKAYETVQQMCEDLLHRPIRISVDHEEYKEKEREYVKYISESKFTDCKHVFKEKKTTSVTVDTVASKPTEQFATTGSSILNDFEEILSDGDVPF